MDNFEAQIMTKLEILASPNCSKVKFQLLEIIKNDDFAILQGLNFSKTQKIASQNWKNWIFYNFEKNSLDLKHCKFR